MAETLVRLPNPSGHWFDYRFNGSACTKCGSHASYDDGGVARCAKHFTPLCRHGYAACAGCGPITVSQRKG